MTQISRPLQIVLAAFVVFAAVWFFALRGHSAPTESSGGSSSVAASASARSSAPAGARAATPAVTAKPAAPSVAGVTRAIDRARRAIGRSDSHRSVHAAKAHGAQPATPRAAKPDTAATLSKQALVEAELKQGHTVIVLFWNPHGAVDADVHRQLQLLHGFVRATSVGAQDKDIAVHYSSAAEVGQYGTITRSLQVLQTPTMLVISPSGKTKTLTGLVDAYAIRQAIAEARSS